MSDRLVVLDAGSADELAEMEMGLARDLVGGQRIEVVPEPRHRRVYRVVED